MGAAGRLLRQPGGDGRRCRGRRAGARSGEDRPAAGGGGAGDDARILKEYWRTFLTLGLGVVLLQAIRQTRQVVIPLWAAHIGLSPTANSLIYGTASLIDVSTFYQAGKVMDVHRQRWVAVPCALILGLSFVLMTGTRSALTLTLVAMLMGFGNGIGSGIVMTLSADVSPEIGRPTFLGLWRELSDTGQGLGPLILSGVTAIAGLAAGIVVSGAVGFAAAGVLWVFIPRRAPPASPAAEPASSSPVTLRLAAPAGGGVGASCGARGAEPRPTIRAHGLRRSGRANCGLGHLGRRPLAQRRLVVIVFHWGAAFPAMSVIVSIGAPRDPKDPR